MSFEVDALNVPNVPLTSDRCVVAICKLQQKEKTKQKKKDLRKIVYVKLSKARFVGAPTTRVAAEGLPGDGRDGGRAANEKKKEEKRQRENELEGRTEGWR